MAIAESADGTAAAQLAVFIRVTDNKRYVTEEVASLVPLKKTTKSLYLYEAVKITLKQFSLAFINISGIAADAALAIVGRREGLLIS